MAQYIIGLNPPEGVLYEYLYLHYLYRRSWTPAGKKMYNYTCDIAQKMGLDPKWLRKCPHGVKSCFWSKTTYQGQSKAFTNTLSNKKHIYSYLSNKRRATFILLEEIFQALRSYSRPYVYLFLKKIIENLG